MRSSLCLSLSHQDAQQSSTPGVHCSRTLQPLLDPTCPTTQKGRGRKGIRLTFESACEHEDALDPGFSGEWAQSRPLRAIAPCGISDEAVPIQHTLIHVLCRGATRGALKPDCAVMHTSVNVPQYGTMSMTSLHVTSASLSYCKPAAAPGHGALSDSPWESPCSAPVTAKPLRSFIIDSADMRWVERGGAERHRERNSEDLFSKE